MILFMARTLEQINRDYQNQCAQLGHREHLLERLPHEIRELRQKLHFLKNETDLLNEPAEKEPHGEEKHFD